MTTFDAPRSRSILLTAPLALAVTLGLTSPAPAASASPAGGKEGHPAPIEAARAAGPEYDLRAAGRERPSAGPTVPGASMSGASDPGRWEGSNPAQELLLVIGEDGARLVPRGAGAGRGWELEIAIGRHAVPGGAGDARGAGRTSVHRNVLASYRGALTEWYANEADGVRVGVTLGVPPDVSGPYGAGASSVDLALEGALAPKLSPDGQVLELFSPEREQVFRIDGLRAVDAEGRDVAASLELIEGEGVHIVLDGNDHVQPLTASLLVRSSWVAKDTGGAAAERDVRLHAPGTPAAGDAAAAGDADHSEEDRAWGSREAGSSLDGGDDPLAPPANDTCAGALTFSPSGTSLASPIVNDITDATSTGDPASAPSCAFGGGPVSRSTWYRYVATTTGPHIVSTCADAPTGTSIPDTVIAVYTSASGCAGPFSERADGCDDDSCVFLDSQAETVPILTSGTTYYIVVWKFGSDPPGVGATAVQVRIIPPSPVPSNDTCSAPRVLALDTPVTAATAGGADDYELSGAGCFTGVGQTASTAAGRDVVYSFSAPTAGRYSFRAQNLVTGGNPVVYVATSCPAATPGSPVTVGTCLAASNRSAGASAFAADEVMCIQLAAGQQVYVYVDESASTITGGTLRLEANRCTVETEPNDVPALANALTCGTEGTISPIGEADFFALGTPAANSRIFVLADGVAGSSTDYDMRITTATDTLEFDDLDAHIPYGSLSPAVAGTKATGAAAYVRMSHHSPVVAAEPYRLYSVVQPASGSATNEAEPNDTLAQAQGNIAANNYFAGNLPGPSPSIDIDHYPFTATAGQLVFLAVDGDPGYDGTAVNTMLALLDSSGAVLSQVNDADAFSNLRTPAAGTLTSTAPLAPAEALTYRVTTTGTYYARVMIGTDQPDSTGSGTYLLSISKNCTIGGGGLSADVSIAQTDVPDPVVAGALITYTITVSNAGPADAFGVTVGDVLPAARMTFVSTSGPCQEGAGGVPTCTLGLVPAGGSVQYQITARVKPCLGAGSAVNTATVSSSTSDPSAANNTANATTTITDPGTCDDGNSCTTGDHCSAGACVGTPITPAEATNLRVQANTTTLTWNAAPGSTSSDVLRGRVGQLPVGSSASASSSDRTFMTSACPSGAPVSDDFRTGVLNTSLWSFVNPLGDGSFTLTTVGADKLVNLVLPSGASHDVWSGGNQAIRLMQTISNLDFEIEVKWTTRPSVGNQLQGVTVEASPGNHIRFDIFHDGTSNRAFVASFVSNSPTIHANTALPPLTAPLWMRIQRTGSSWTMRYSTNGTSFTPVVTFNHTLTVTKFGPFAGNFGSPTAPAFTSSIDYVFNTASPIVPEDGPGGAEELQRILATPPVISGIGAVPSAFAATIAWTTDVPANSRVDYGTTTAYGTIASDPAFVTSHSVPLSGLSCNTLYHYRVTSATPAGVLETCLGNVPGTSTTDAFKPPIGAASWYLVRGRNSCGPGTWGTTSSGAPRVTGTCP